MTRGSLFTNGSVSFTIHKKQITIAEVFFTDLTETDSYLTLLGNLGYRLMSPFSGIVDIKR
jgi:hypothetical protein